MHAIFQPGFGLSEVKLGNLRGGLIDLKEIP